MKLRNALLAGLLGLACGPGAVMWAAAETRPVPTWVGSLPVLLPLYLRQITMLRPGRLTTIASL